MRFFSSLAALLLVVLLAACGGGGGSPGATPGTHTALFTTAPSNLTLSVGSAQEFTVAGGTGAYSAVSNNAAIAVAGVSENRLTLGAVSPGTAQITLRDSSGGATNISVTAVVQQLFTTAPSSVTLVSGSSGAQTFRVGGGGGQFTATSSNVNIVTASLSGESLLVTGVTAGTASIVVRDNFGTLITIPVTVTGASNLALFTSAPAAVTIAVRAAPVYTIGGGVGPYTATSSNTNVATAAVSEGNLTVTGVSTGTASIVIRDSVGATLNIAVTVGGGQLTVNPSTATALIGDVLFARVTGGRAPYTAVVTNAAVADATITSDGLLRVALKQQAGSVPILITDADGLSTSFTVTSAAGQPAIQMSPSALTISELSNDSLTFQVFGANGAIRAFSSDTSLLTAFASGNTVTVLTGSKGNRCVAADTTVTISVVDSVGALATSAISIRNSASLTCP